MGPCLGSQASTEFHYLRHYSIVNQGFTISVTLAILQYILRESGELCLYDIRYSVYLSGVGSCFQSQKCGYLQQRESVRYHLALCSSTKHVPFLPSVVPSPTILCVQPPKQISRFDESQVSDQIFHFSVGPRRTVGGLRNQRHLPRRNLSTAL